MHSTLCILHCIGNVHTYYASINSPFFIIFYWILLYYLLDIHRQVLYLELSNRRKYLDF